MSGRKTWACSTSLSYGDFFGAPSDRLTQSEPGWRSRPEKTREQLLKRTPEKNPSVSSTKPDISKTKHLTHETSHSSKSTSSARSEEKFSKPTTATRKDSDRVFKPHSGATKQGLTSNRTNIHSPPPSNWDSKTRQSKGFDNLRESSGYGSQEKGFHAKSATRASSGYGSSENSLHSMPGKIHSERDGSKARTDKKLGMQHESLKSDKDVEVYKDNSQNRRLNRAGLPIGSAVHHKATGTVTKEQYVDSPKNRTLRRVGLPRGSKPNRKNHPTTKAIQILVKGEEIDDSSLEDKEYRGLNYDLPSIKQYAKVQAICIRNREQEEQILRTKRKLISTKSDFMKFKGNDIPFEELTLYKKIGEGGFGEVYIAVWNNSIVAVKRLKVGGVSTRRFKEFLDEIKRCCNLQHSNIVRFIGACLEESNLSFVMEYMQMSLFEGLHIKNINLQENQKISIIQQITMGLKYLHGMKIAHCDLKPQNILLSIEDDQTCIAKITDFGLSMVKEHTRTASDTERAKHIGTPRYSAPEVLRGELLGASEMMKADVYSISLVYFEIIYEEEPFYNFSFSQLQKQIGQMGYIPERPEDRGVKKQTVDLVYKGLAFNASSRPTISEIEGQWKRFNSL